jgi:hypothetical protein
MRPRLAIACVSLLAVAACGYRPARFADRDVVMEVHDDRPISVPKPRTTIQPIQDADVYVRRSLVGALDPRRPGHALDVNALDEVARSSWWSPPSNPGRPLADYERDGPPLAPWRVSDDETSSGIKGAIVVVDARGIRYELIGDIPNHPGMRTGAAIISSRLLHALGYRSAETYLVEHEGNRMAALRWPVGIDVGETPLNSERIDDPNDHLPHLRRRTLRTLRVFTTWLASSRLPRRVLRDVYVGRKGAGHVQHYLVGLDDCLGVADLQFAKDWLADADREEPNFYMRLFSMGLSPKPIATEPVTAFPSVGLFNAVILQRHRKPSPPYEPADYTLPADTYWAGKRLASLTIDSIAQSIAAAHLGDAAQNWVFQVLHVRRAKLIAEAFDATTPLELMTVSPPTPEQPARLVLLNLAIQSGFVDAEELDYRVTFHDEQGNVLLSLSQDWAAGAVVTIPLRAELAEHDYVVARVRGLRKERALPRAFEAHLMPAGRSFEVVGIRH